MTSPFGDGHHHAPRQALLLASVLLLCLVAGCCTTDRPAPELAPEAPAEPLLDAEQRQANADSFEKTWQTVNDTFWDPDFGGVDWAGVRAEFTPRIAAATTLGEARLLMKEALDRLGESHFYVIPSELYEDVAGAPTGRGDCGLRVRVVDGRALVVKVLSGSPADEAGVGRGWEVLAARDDEFAPFIERLQTEYAGSNTLASKLAYAVRGRMGGEIGDELTLRLRDGEDRERALTLTLAEPVGHKAVFGNLPPAWIRVRTERLDGDIGYISLNAFMDPTYTMTAVNEAMASYGDCRGVVLDLRGNGGGIAGMAPGVAGWFVTEKRLSLGEMVTRNSQLNLLVHPRTRAFTGPVAVLIDGLSASTSEFLAAGLRDLGRARLFGTRSAGAALVAGMMRLPNGDGFEYAFADYESAGGTRIEGVGITPDVETPYARASLLAGEDAALDAAVAWITESH